MRLLQRLSLLRLLCAYSEIAGMGKLQTFDTETNWEEYRERVEPYFIANNVKEKR